MDKLLYYPTISILDPSWLPKALLYWDGIATIAPAEYLNDPSRFSPFTHALLKKELIEIVQPEWYAYSHYREFTAFFEWALRNADSFILEPYKESHKLNGGSIIPYKLHIEKLSDQFGSELVRADLAQRVDDEWFLVHPKLGESFMTFLAILIGQETDRDPVTDRFTGVSSLFFVDRHTASKHSAAVRSALRNSILDDILPVPQKLYGMKGLEKVRCFKERYHDELERFRRHIEEFILSVDGQSEAVQNERREIFLKNAQEEIEELKGHMGWFQVPQIDLGTFIAAAPCAFSTLSGDYAGAAVSIAALVGETMYNRERTHNRRKPLAYAALYQRGYGRWQTKRSTTQ